MAPYIAVSVYGHQPGDVVPDADEAMIEVGAVEWVDSGAPDIPEVPATDDGTSPGAPEETAPEEDAEAAPAPSDPDLDAMDIKSLREAAKAAGVNSFGKSKAELRELLGVT